jgi:hypothetical protein
MALGLDAPRLDARRLDARRFGRSVTSAVREPFSERGDQRTSEVSELDLKPTLSPRRTTMSRKVLFTLATAATLAAAATFASTAADARGFGGGGGGGHFGGGGGFSRGGFGGGFSGGHFGGRSFVGRSSFSRITPIRGGRPGLPGRWAYHHHGHWFFRGGRWIILDGVDGGYDQPVADAQPVVSTPGPCTCLTKTYTPDGLVVFADVCTKEAASARVDGADVTTLPPANSSDKSSDATPAPAPAPTAQTADNVVAQASQAPTTTNYAGKTFQDFLAANAQAKKN